MGTDHHQKPNRLAFDFNIWWHDGNMHIMGKWGTICVCLFGAPQWQAFGARMYANLFKWFLRFYCGICCMFSMDVGAACGGTLASLTWFLTKTITKSRSEQDRRQELNALRGLTWSPWQLHFVVIYEFDWKCQVEKRILNNDSYMFYKCY